MSESYHKLEELVDIPRLTAWLDTELPELGSGPLDVALLHGGHSNAVLSLNRGSETMVLRRPPVVPPPGSTKSILREARLLRALNQTDVPHPECHAACDDEGVIGAPFYIMEMVTGWNPKIVDSKIVNEAPFDRPENARGVFTAVVDGLIQLANVDYEAIGLSDYGKPGNFLERQVDRWASQLASYPEKYDYTPRPLPDYQLVEDWLRANTPKSYKPGIIHGDVGTPNMFFSRDIPTRLTAMLDWELSTIGDPLIDMGWFCGGMVDARVPERGPASDLHDPAAVPAWQEMAERYAAGTGRDVSEFDYYLVLAKFKSGCIMEYKVALAAKGKMPREAGEFFKHIVDTSFAGAAELVRLAER